MPTCLLKVTYKHSIFFFPIYLFFIGNGFFFHMIHPEHSFHSPTPLISLRSTSPLFLQTKASLQEATAKLDKPRCSKTRLKCSYQGWTRQPNICMFQDWPILWINVFKSQMPKKLCKGKCIQLQTNPLSNQEIRYKTYHEASLCK